MSVYTMVSDEMARALVARYRLSEFVALKGIAQGVTNSNFFLITQQNRYILTVFEALSAAELPFFMHLMQHLAEKGVACPRPMLTVEAESVIEIAGKSAALVSCLAGRDVAFPNEKQCFNVGTMFARMHVATQDFSHAQPNPRYRLWWQNAAQQLEPHLSSEDKALLHDEVQFLAQFDEQSLPAGIIHADLFRDNVLMQGDEVAGFIDFYYASSGVFVYDIAIALNDWARLADNSLSDCLTKEFLRGYESVRPLTLAEHDYLHIARRAACVRFWVSRLLDLHFSREGALTFTKDPNVFRDLLIHFRASAI